ncbi:reverse transcriptase domain-containing protein [Tanacetum coccineum]
MLTCRRTCQVRSNHQNSGEAGMSKDRSGSELLAPSKCNGIKGKSDKAGRRRIKPQKGSVVPFPFDNEHPTSAFVGQTGNTSRTLNIKPNERSESKRKPYPSSMPEQTLASVAQQMAQRQKRGSGKQKHVTNCKGKCKNRDAKEPGQTKWVRRRTIIGMVRGKTNKKRPHEQSEQWTNNEISFPSMPGTNRSEKFRSRGFHHPLDDKVPHCQWDYNNDNQERNPSRIPEDGRSARTGPRREDRSPLTQAPEPKGTTIKGKEKDELLENLPEGKPPEKVIIHDDHPHQTITIGGNLTTECRSELIKILRKHADAFAWTPADMTKIPRFVAEHKLRTYPHIEPRVPRKRIIAPDRGKVVKDEVAEWLKVGIVRKVRYPTWVAHPVLVKKPDNSWRMCIDFKYLNKACPKDLYPLPEIDWKIKSLMGFKYKCFLDAYKGYHQIQMAKKDEEKTTFHTDEGVFCYTKMPFRLKNARATYQRLVDTIFEGQMGRNLEAYVDDMVIKSKTELEMIKDVE